MTTSIEEGVDTPIPPRTVSIDGKEYDLTRRVIGTKDGDRHYDFLVIDSPSKWAAAAEFKGSHDMQLGGDRPLRVGMRGLSYDEWARIEMQSPMPSLPEDADTDKPEVLTEHERKVEMAIAQRRVLFFELSTGKTIPGAKLEEKALWLMQRSPKTITSMFESMQNVVCNFTDGPLINSYIYDSVMEKSDSAAFHEFSNFDDWTIASESRYFFRVHRQTDDYLVEFPLRGISAEDKQKIEDQTQTPPAPKILGRDPITKRMDPSRQIPNFNDPAWKERARTVQNKRIVMFFEACLVFEIPGSNYQEKYKWLSARLVGDIVRLRKYIETEIAGLGAHYEGF